MITLILLLLTTHAQASSASHVYLSEDCVSPTHEFRYLGTYPNGGYYGLWPTTNSDSALLIPADAEHIYEPEEIEGMDMLYRASGYVETAPEERSKDLCFDTTVTHYRQTLTFEKVKPEPGEKVGISEGQAIEFTCRMQLDVPRDEGCE